MSLPILEKVLYQLQKDLRRHNEEMSCQFDDLRYLLYKLKKVCKSALDVEANKHHVVRKVL